VDQRRILFRRHPGPQTYTLTTPYDDEFDCDSDYHQDEAICELRKLLGTTIIAARRMSQNLDPPPPIETYSALNKLGARMFFQLMETHGNEWNIYNHHSPNRRLSIQDATDSELKHFLEEQEIDTWRPGIPGEIFMDDTLDLYRLLDIIIKAAHFESPQLRPIPQLEIPDSNYELARVFHYYFSPYHTKLASDFSLTRTANHEVVEFILQEYNQKPINTPLTHEQAEEQSFQIKLIKFLIAPEGQRFLNSIYKRLFEDPGKLKPEYQAFITLYWRYKKYWKQKQRLEQAPIADITRFLSKYYMEFWRQQLSTQNKLGTI
jgi:hypothetical protein